jgi:lysophospholipase L1-like esterase
MALGVELGGRLLRGIVACALAVVVAALAACGGGDPAAVYQTTWSAAMQNYNNPVLTPAPAVAYFQNQTIRQRMRASVGGTSIKVRVSNVFGTTPLVLDSVRIARASADPAAAATDIDVTSDTAVTFQATGSVTVAPGQETWSDDVAFKVPDRGDLVVSIYVSAQVPVATFHSFANQAGGVVAGNATSVGALVNPTRVNSVYWVSKIDVRNDAAKGVVVAIGDSITDGAGTTSGANKRWTNQLDARLAADPAWASYGVVNAGILGNRILFDGIGPKAVDRFARDVLEATHVKAAVILLGVNDINIGPTVAGQEVTAQQVIDGLTTMIRAGQGAGKKVFLGTIMPNKGFTRYPFTEAGEAKRQAVNAWIRSNPLANGAIDFDAIVRNPADPTTLNPAYNSGDNLHPNDAGAKAMADGFNLNLISGL